MPSVDCALLHFAVDLAMDLCGNLIGQTVDVSGQDATACFYVKKSDMRNVFQFATNGDILDNLSANDMRYYVVDPSGTSTSLTGILSNIGNGMMDQPLSVSPISTFDSSSTNYASNEMLIKHDFVRHIAKDLFNTPFGTDFFTNQKELILNIDKICGSEAGFAYALFKTALALNSTVSPTNTLSVDAESKHYATNADVDPSNLARELALQIFKGDRDRFIKGPGVDTIDDTSQMQSIPFMNGDKVSFLLTLNADPNQGNIFSPPGTVSERIYKIVLLIVDDADYGTTYINTPPLVLV